MESSVLPSDFTEPQTVLPYKECGGDTYEKAPVGSLPVELLTSIFRYCDSEIAERLKLSHTCHHWRIVAVDDAELWTDIRIERIGALSRVISDTTFDLLETQLNRSKDQPLDVVWNISTSPSFNRKTVDIFRRKGPFHRWRSLCLYHSCVGEPPGIELGATDRFTDLRRITLKDNWSNFIVNPLNHTATSKLCILDMSMSKVSHGSAISHLGPLFSRISCYHPPRWEGDVFTLPANIAEVRVVTLDLEQLSHVQTYTLHFCVIRNNDQLDLNALTSLTITRVLVVAGKSNVLLPSLRYLKFLILEISSGASLSAPMLDTLVLGTEGNDSMKDLINRSKYARSSSELLVSPKESLIIGVFVSITKILELMSRCPRIRQATISFIKEDIARRVMVGLGIEQCTESEREDDGGAVMKTLCPQLSDLRLEFQWGISEVDAWRGRAAELVEKRRKLGMELVVYASWKGEGTFLRLA